MDAGLALALYWIDTRWGCGGILVNEQGIVIDGAPIFRRLIGQSVASLRRSYRLVQAEAAQ